MAFLTTPGAEAGDKIGNGAGLWSCGKKDSSGQKILIDLFEAEAEFGYRLIPAEARESTNAIYLRQRRELLAGMPELAAALAPHFEEVEKRIRFVDAELLPTEDLNLRVKPADDTCRGGEWSYLQLANYTDYGTLLVRRSAWNDRALSGLSRAAFYFHEAVYRWLRAFPYEDTDSRRTRQIVGILFSTEAWPEKRAAIEALLAPDLGSGL